MAIIETRNQLMLLAGVSRANWEDEPTPEVARRRDETDTIVRFRWQPGNGTSYDLQYTMRLVSQFWADPDEEPETLWKYTLSWFGADGGTHSAARTIEWCSNSHLAGHWFADVMGINDADAQGLMLLLEALGHSVSMPRCEVTA